MERNFGLDFIKGIAVLLMIFANTSIYFIDLTNNYSVRFIFSIAAPVFLFLTGYISQMTLSKKNNSRSNFFYRAFQILFLGAMIDVIFWKSVPFVTFDILYLIAISHFLMMIINYKQKFLLLLLLFFCFFLTNYFPDYRFAINDLSINSNLTYKDLYNSKPIQRLLFDGWFPILPWLAFVFLGAITFENRLFVNKNSLFFPIR